MRAASLARPVADTIAARRADRNPSSSSGCRAKSASDIARFTTASPRNSSRSLWPRAASGCSWSQLLWTSACSRRSRSRIGRRRCSAKAAALPTNAAWRGSGGVFVDVVDGVLDGADLLGILVRNLRPELLFEAHDQLDEVERVGVEIVNEGGLGLDL